MNKEIILKNTLVTIAALMLTFACSSPRGKDYPITPLNFTDVRLKDTFWTPRENINRTVTIPHAFHQCEVTGRIDNFAKAGGLMEGKFEGLRFNDSDVYKVIEGASYTLAIHPDPELDQYLDDLIGKIAAAQEEDGYLYTPLIIDPGNPPRGVGSERWISERTSHELYCAGHLYEAAVAHYLATSKRTLLDVALKNADLVANVFGPNKRRAPPGHQEIELGLVKLYRITGKNKYLRLAKFFLEERGRFEGRESYGEYFQDHKPVLEQKKVVGHAVRAGYMYSAMVDISALTGDRRYAETVKSAWENVVSKKIYITGGVGGGNSEGFSEEYILPNRRAYNETCASIANALWNHRMFLLTGDARYIDVLERVIYNAFLSGIAMTGDLFFYHNRLATFEGEERRPWFNCACCPSNVVRFIPQVAGFIYAQNQDDIYINLFAESETVLTINRRKVKLTQETNYPEEGKVIIKVEPEAETKLALHIRIPGWTQDKPLPGGLYSFLDSPGGEVKLFVNGKETALTTDKGFAVLSRKWQAGDTVELHLPMAVRRVIADEKVTNNRGRVALSRGPLIYCVEWPDNPEGVHHLVLPDDSRLCTEFRSDLLGGFTLIHGKAFSTRYADRGQSINIEGKTDFTAIPYYAWAHRGPGQMVVWMARVKEAARPLPEETIAYTSAVSASNTGPRTTLSALNDQVIPTSSDDLEVPSFTWQPQKGTKEWVQYDFAEPTLISETEVYWFDNAPRGIVRIPKEWRVLYAEEGQWKPVSNPSGYELRKDRFNRVTFDPVKTHALRIEVQLQSDWSAGILEWRVK
ncbi:MAG: glycoside hydrolase family 127 protein [Deltaproteobacteria bacterium]|nr:glycoside hydrolase family 127 protein [Deltaproteobacteria bacterium]